MRSATAVVALLFLQPYLCLGAKTIYFHKSSVNGRVKRSWTYPAINIMENMVPDETIATIKSNAPDLSYYAIASPQLNGKNVFAMDESTGAITQLQAVDRETQDKFNMTAYAYNAAGKRVEEPVDLVINVFDANDNVPVFDEDSLVGNVPENHAISPTSNFFMTVTSTDQDKGSNAEVKYWIVDNSESPKKTPPRFSIDDVGHVYVNSALDYETDNLVTFQVVAKDTPKLASGNQVTATVTVHIEDSNDHAPIMDATPPRTLSELSPLNTPLYTVFATDVDEGVNKMVYFYFDNGNTGGKFEINSFPSDTESKSRGEIILVKPLDFESGIISYDLVIVAYNKDADNADSAIYRSTTTVNIKVSDANEPPIFANVPYVATLSEATPPTTPLDIQIAANDPDFNGNQTVSFSIATDPEFWFTIDPVTGQLKTNSLLDRESPNVVDSTYTLTIRATDNYPGNKASADYDVQIFITDVNDNSPVITIPGLDSDGAVKICEKPLNRTVTIIHAEDPDTTQNGPPFVFAFGSEVDSTKWAFEKVSAKSQMVVTFVKDFDLSSNPSEYYLLYTVSDSGSPIQITTATMTVSICQCDDSGIVNCSAGIVGAGGFPLAVVIAIIVLFLIVIILVLSVIAYRRNRSVDKLKEPILYDEDDVRENIQVYHDEGGGEEDQEAYDLSTLRRPLMDPNEPIRVDEKPLKAQPQSRMPPGVSDDIGDYIGDAKDQADSDPSAPPFDSLLVFDYEGAGSDAGSLSSINTATTDGSVDYDYLNNWGPRFKRLADMYNDGSESE